MKFSLVPINGAPTTADYLMGVTAAGVDYRVSNATLAALIALNTPSGTVIQQAITTYTTLVTGSTIIPHDNTIPQNTEGDQYMSMTITPKFASSTIIVDVEIMVAFSGNGYKAVAMFQDSGVNAVAGKFTYQGNWTDPTVLTMRYAVVAGTTSPITFKVRGGSEIAGTYSMNASYFGSIAKSSIQITEVKG